MDIRRRNPTSYDVFHENLRLHGFRDYNEYLHSDCWRQFNDLYRQSELTQHCLACRSSEFLLHHWTYERITFENISDVIPLCAGCHEALHKWLKNNPEVRLTWVRQQLRQCFGMSREKADEVFAPFLDMQRRLQPKENNEPCWKMRQRQRKVRGPIKLAGPKPPKFVCPGCNKLRSSASRTVLGVCGVCANRQRRKEAGLVIEAKKGSKPKEPESHSDRRRLRLIEKTGNQPLPIAADPSPRQ